MAKLKISENLFLEVAELNRMVKFLTDYGYKRILKSMIKRVGIVVNDDNTYFKVTQKSGNVVTINPGIAFDTNLDAIIMENSLDMTITDSGTKRWLILSRAVKNWEDGTVAITGDGALTGTGTKFTEILRGQPNFPTKVKFNSTNNTEEYEVVSVTSDTSAILTGDFIPESGKQFSVIGTFTPGFNPLEENKQIYEYDSYAIRIEDSASRPNVTDDEFILAYVSYSGGVMEIGDERVYSLFNTVYNQDVENTGDSPMTSLLAATIVGGVDSWKSKAAEIELILEHGYKVVSYELNQTATHNVFQIVSGTNNFYGTDAVPDGTFDGWILLNRTNMKYVQIDYSVGGNLYISKFYAELISSDVNDFVVIPNFANVEYEVKVTGNGSVTLPSIPFYYKSSIENIQSRVKFYVIYPSFGGADSVNVSIRYRFVDDGDKKYPFHNLAVAHFTDVNGNDDVLANSVFTVNVTAIEPEAEERNYS